MSQNAGPNKLTFTKSDGKWDVEPGVYRVRFVDLKETNHPEFGAGLCWSFEVVAGPSEGKFVERNTGCVPTANSACGRILTDILGREGKEGEEIDTNALIGRLYLAKVARKAPPSKGVRVESLTPLEMIEQTARQTAQPMSQPQTPAPAAPGGPPRRPGAAPAATVPLVRWWVCPRLGADSLPNPMTADQIRRLIADKMIHPESVYLMPEDQSNDWMPATEYGFKDEIPF